MCDEYDEGTNFLPTVTTEDQLPSHDKFKFIVPDADRPDLPSDWYMRIAGYAAEALKGKYKIGKVLPERDLRDWYSTHPRATMQSLSASVVQSSQPWPSAVENTKDDFGDAPPPYTLEAEPNTIPVETARPVIPAATRPEPPPAPPETRPRPPVAPTLSRPQAPPVPQNTRPDARPDPVHALADDLRRQSMSRPDYPPPSAVTRPASKAQLGRASSFSSQLSPTEWNTGSSHMPAPSRPVSSYAPPLSDPGYRPGYVSLPNSSVSSYPGMQQEPSSFYMPSSPTAHPSYMPPSPTSFGMPSNSPHSAPTTLPPPGHGLPPPGSASFRPPPGPPRSSGPTISFPDDGGFVGGFGGTGYEPIYAPPPGPPPGHPHRGPPPPPRPPPRWSYLYLGPLIPALIAPLGKGPVSAHPPSQGGSYYVPPSPPPRATSARPGASGMQGYAQNALGYASGAVGRVAGEDHRRRIEQGAGYIAQGTPCSFHEGLRTYAYESWKQTPREVQMNDP
jgi:hypothetical protein